MLCIFDAMMARMSDASEVCFILTIIVSRRRYLELHKCTAYVHCEQVVKAWDFEAVD